MVFLIKEREVYIDEEDFGRVSKYKWVIQKICDSNLEYVRCTQKIGSLTHPLLHRFILNFPTNPKVIDHINRNGLDNRKSNLRLCENNRENLFNRKMNKNNVSGFRGVHLDRDTNKWRAIVTVMGKKTHLGLFDSKEYAHIVYEVARESLYT